VDNQTLQKILTQLISKSPVGDLFKGIASYSDGEMHLVLSGDGDKIDLDQMKQLIGMLAKNFPADEDGQPLFDVESFGPDALTVVVKALGSAGIGPANHEVGTLRDAINREWPW